MTARSRRIVRSAIRAAAFLVAVAAGWSVKWAFTCHTGANNHPAPPAATAAPMVVADPDDLLAIDTRLALADQFLDADAAKLQRLAEGMVEKKADYNTWRALFGVWFPVAPGDAWRFAAAHPERLDTGRKSDPFSASRGMDADSLRQLAVQVWSRLDPRAARAALSGPDDGDFIALVEGSMECDVAYAFQLLGEMDEDRWWQVADLPRHLARLARQHPALALEWVDRLGSDDNDSYPALLVGWLHQDPAAAEKWLETTGDAEYHIEEAVNLVENDTTLYHPGLLDLLVRRMSPSVGKISRATDLLCAVAEKDLALALRETERAVPDRETRAAIYLEIVKRTDLNPGRAWDVLSRIEPGASGAWWAGETEPEQVGEAAATRNPERTLPFFAGFPSLSTGEDLSDLTEVKRRTLGAMFRANRDQALACLGGCKAEEIPAVGDDLIPQWAAVEPFEAAAWLSRHISKPGEDLAVESWFGNAFLTAEEMRTLPGSLAPGAFRDAFVAWAAEQLSPDDPVAALDFARSNAGSPTALTDAYNRWAAADADAALEALARDEDAPPQAWEEVVHHAVEKNPEGMAEWVAEMEPGPNRDAALKALAGNPSRRVPFASRAAWSCAIHDEAARRDMLDATLNALSLDLRAANDLAVLSEMRASIQSASTMNAAEKQAWLGRLQTEFSPSP